MKIAPRFTVVETLVTIIFLGVASTVGYTVYEALQMTHRDQVRKVAINTIHANLQEIVKPNLGGYPRTLDPSQLTAMDRSYLKDPQGAPIGTGTSDYRYEPTSCNGGDVCAGYTLTADLEREADFTKPVSKH